MCVLVCFSNRTVYAMYLNLSFFSLWASVARVKEGHMNESDTLIDEGHGTNVRVVTFMSIL